MAIQATTITPPRPHLVLLASVMRMAWVFHREVGGRAFAESLRAAWAWVKRLEASRVAKAFKAGGRLRLKHTLPSLNVYRAYGRRAFACGRGSQGYISSVVGS